MSDFAQPDFNDLLRQRRLAMLLQTQQPPQVDTNPPQTPPQEAPPAPPVGSLTQSSPTAPSPNARMLYEQQLAKMPKLEDYHPSGLRKALSIMAGIGEGIAAKNPQAGINIAREVKYGPFETQMNLYRRNLAEKEAAMKSEEEGKKFETAQQEGVTKTEAEKERATAEKLRGEREGAETRALTPGTPEFSGKMQLTEAQHPPLSLEKDLVDLTLSDGTKVKGARESIVNGELRYISPDGRTINPGAIVSAQKQSNSQEKFTNGYQVAIREFQQTHGRLPTEEENTKIVREQAEASGLFGQREAAANLAKARTSQIWDAVKPASQAEIAQAQMMNARDPSAYWQWLGKQPASMRRDLLLKVPPSAFLTGGERDRIGNSNVALWHVDSLRDMIKDPFIKAHLGPILGRIDLANSTFGGDFIGGTPEEQEKEQQFLSFLTANLLWETTSGVGTRPARQTIELIKRTAPRASESEAQILGALDAEEKSAKNIQKGLLKGNPDTVKSEGGGFKNIQEEQ